MRNLVVLPLVLLGMGACVSVITNMQEEPAPAAGSLPEAGVAIVFEEIEDYAFSQTEKDLITAVTLQSKRDVAELLPTLPETITITILPTTDDLSIVGGIAGLASSPHGVIATISTSYPGGVSAAINYKLRSHYFHEFHHLARGWTIEENKFEQGIDIAAINEGLAEVFDIQHTGVTHDVLNVPDDVEDWVVEILALPADANYSQWMNVHPDGRIAVGYRAGRHIVEKAMLISNETIYELSDRSPDEIIALAGYD